MALEHPPDDDLSWLDAGLPDQQTEFARTLEARLKEPFLSRDLLPYCVIEEGSGKQPRVVILVNEARHFSIGYDYGDDVIRVREGWNTTSQLEKWTTQVIAVVDQILHDNPMEIEPPLEELPLRRREVILAEIAVTSSELVRLREVVDDLVAEGRAQNIPWSEIGRSAGIKPQTAYQRWNETGKIKHRDRQRNRHRASDF